MLRAFGFNTTGSLKVIVMCLSLSLSEQTLYSGIACRSLQRHKRIDGQRSTRQ
jgi:hypothetical protein